MSNERVAANLNKLNNLNVEINRLSQVLKDLRLQKSHIEDEIVEYLRATDQSGIEYNGMFIENKFFKKQHSKTKDDREQSMIRVLENNGIHNSKEVLEQLLKSTKDVVEGNKLKIKPKDKK
jgi:hypothetical protein